MSKIDLSGMSLSELKQHAHQVTKLIKTVEDEQRREAIAALEEVATEKGFTLYELTHGTNGETGRRPKFKHPDKPGVTWSGLGRRPAWFNEALDRGMRKEDLQIP